MLTEPMAAAVSSGAHINDQAARRMHGPASTVAGPSDPWVTDGDDVQDPPPSPPCVPGPLYDAATLAAFERMSRIAHVALPLPLPPTSGPPPVRMHAFFLPDAVRGPAVLPENAHVEMPKPPSAAPGRTTMRALVRPPAPGEAVVPTLAEFNSAKSKRKGGKEKEAGNRSVPRVHGKKRKAWKRALSPPSASMRGNGSSERVGKSKTGSRPRDGGAPARVRSVQPR